MLKSTKIRTSKALDEMAKAMKLRKAQEKAKRVKGRVANDEPIGLVNEFTARHGDYERNLRHTVNRGGTALDRWIRDGQISEIQQSAIRHCYRLWELTDTSGRLVANLDRTVFGSPGEGNMAEIEARSDLKRIKGGFPHPLDKYFDVFENVCRWDEPAGTAGSRLATNTRSAIEAARLCVCMVADLIANRERLTY